MYILNIPGTVMAIICDNFVSSEFQTALQDKTLKHKSEHYEQQHDCQFHGLFYVVTLLDYSFCLLTLWRRATHIWFVPHS
jgi:hypothetical protein